MTTRECQIGRCRTNTPPDWGSYACHDCLTLVQHQIVTIEDNLPRLTPQRGQGAQTDRIHRAVPDSRSPAVDDIIVMLDPRSRSNGYQSEYGGRADRPDDDTTPALSIPAVVGAWCETLWTGSEDPWPSTLAAGLGYLRLHLHDRIGREPWAAEFADEIRQLYWQVRNAVGDQPVKPVATCTELYRGVRCGGDVYEQPRLVDAEGEPSGGARCRACSRVFLGMDLVRLHRQQEAS